MFSLLCVFLSHLLLQSPDETDKKKILKPAAENKNTKNKPADDDDVFTEKHSESLFQRTEVLAGECCGL